MVKGNSGIMTNIIGVIGKGVALVVRSGGFNREHEILRVSCVKGDGQRERSVALVRRCLCMVRKADETVPVIDVDGVRPLPSKSPIIRRGAGKDEFNGIPAFGQLIVQNIEIQHQHAVGKTRA